MVRGFVMTEAAMSLWSDDPAEVDLLSFDAVAQTSSGLRSRPSRPTVPSLVKGRARTGISVRSIWRFPSRIPLFGRPWPMSSRACWAS